MAAPIKSSTYVPFADRKTKAERLEPEVRKRISPPGTLGLPELLDQRRHQFAIMDGCFKWQAAFERVLVWGLPPAEGSEKMAPDSAIFLPDSAQERLEGSCPRGIVLSAGLAALDALRSNGIDIGHIVLFTHYVIGQTPAETIDGETFCVKIMKAGDISGSEDTARLMREGKLRIEKREIDGIEQHCYVWADGEAAGPKGPAVVPWSPKDI